MSRPSPALCLPAPPSKSVTHRAYLLAAMAKTPCRVRRPLVGADCQSTLAVLAGLGANFVVRADGDVQFEPAALRPPTGALDCGNSGTTLRLMIGQCARLPFAVTLTGDASLRSRPNGPLLDALATLGVTCESRGGQAPIEVVDALPARLAGPEVTLPGGLSSQYASSLLLAMAMVPVRLGRFDVVASLTMGGKVACFCSRPGANPPPWIMNPGITR